MKTITDHDYKSIRDRLWEASTAVDRCLQLPFLEPSVVQLLAEAAGNLRASGAFIDFQRMVTQ